MDKGTQAAALSVTIAGLRSAGRDLILVVFRKNERKGMKIIVPFIPLMLRKTSKKKSILSLGGIAKGRKIGT
jgi:hypothetical protein